MVDHENAGEAKKGVGRQPPQRGEKRSSVRDVRLFRLNELEVRESLLVGQVEPDT